MNGYQLLVALVATCGGLLYGYEIGVMNVVLVMDAFRMFFGLYKWKGVMVNDMDDDVNNSYVKDKTPLYRKLEENGSKPFLDGFITSSFLFGAIFGAILSSHLSNKICSQKVIMYSGLLFSLGSIIQGGAFGSFITLSLGRLVSGIAIGGISVLCPTYIAEVAPARIRNSVITCYQLMIAIGIVMASIINGFIWYTTNVKPENTTNPESVSNKEWRLALWLQVVPGLLLSLFMYFLPSSPRYLCSQNKDKEAIGVLAKLNGASVTDILVQEEYKATIVSVTNMEALGKSSYKELFDRRNRRRSLITFFMQLFQQCTGINAILYYQTQLFHGVGFSRVMSAIILPAINSVVYFISSFIGMINVQRIGRKHLLVIGGILLIVLNVAITTTSNHTRDHYEFRLSEKIDCTNEKNDLAFFSDELQQTFYGNDCHSIKITCNDHRNVISFDATSHTYTTEQLDDICREMDPLRYAKGNFRRYLFAGSIFLFTLVYGSTWGPVPKVYQAEVFPLRMRVKGTTFSTVSHFVTSWFVVFITPILIQMWGMHVFILFTVCCNLALIFAIFFCIEPRGLSMEEIDEEMVLIKS